MWGSLALEPRCEWREFEVSALACSRQFEASGRIASDTATHRYHPVRKLNYPESVGPSLGVDCRAVAAYP
jgi:hypothetical protein